MLLNALGNEAAKIQELERKKILTRVPKGIKGRKYDDSWYIFNKNEKISEHDIKWLYKFDNSMYELSNIHIIYNFNDIKSKLETEKNK